LRVAHPESFNHVEMMMKRSLDGKKETKLSSFLLCRRGRKLPRASAAAAAAQIFTVFYLSRLSKSLSAGSPPTELFCVCRNFQKKTQF
jgi:hypothetical protein